jgi:hypothetical protein
MLYRPYHHHLPPLDEPLHVIITIFYGNFAVNLLLLLEFRVAGLRVTNDVRPQHMAANRKSILILTVKLEPACRDIICTTVAGHVWCTYR